MPARGAACVGGLGLPLASGRAFVHRFDDEEHGIESADLERILGDVRYTPAAVRLIGPVPSSAPSPARSYARYRAKFLTPELISAGSRFWSLHAEDLARAEAEYGVPSEVIIGILGVETFFGRNTGSFRAIDALGDDRLRRRAPPGLLPRRIERIAAAGARLQDRSARHQGLVCRSGGFAAVHAL